MAMRRVRRQCFDPHYSRRSARADVLLREEPDEEEDEEEDEGSVPDDEGDNEDEDEEGYLVNPLACLSP